MLVDHLVQTQTQAQVVVVRALLEHLQQVELAVLVAQVLHQVSAEHLHIMQAVVAAVLAFQVAVMVLSADQVLVELVELVVDPLHLQSQHKVVLLELRILVAVVVAVDLQVQA
jgi:hypothetical protein